MSLEEIDARIAELRDKGSHLEALGLVEEGIEIRKKIFGLSSEEVKKSYAQLCDMCNIVAAEYLQRDDFYLALDLLKKAELLSGNDNAARAKTLNNLACYYRQAGKVRIAQNYLMKALDLEENLASTHLNLCAVLSQLEKHQQALTHAMQAVMALQEQTIENPQALTELAPMLAIAYHNMGVELEYLKRIPEALTNYKKSQEISAEYLPQDHPIAINAAKARQLAVKNMKGEKKKDNKKPRNRGNKKSKAKLSTGYLSDEDIEIINKAWRSANEKKLPEDNVNEEL